MSEQLSILDLPPVGAVGQRDPLTSATAARECQAPRQRELLLVSLVKFGQPVTADDLADDIDVPAYIVRARLPQLAADGLVRVEGDGPARGLTKRRVQAWTITAAGRAGLRAS